MLLEYGYLVQNWCNYQKHCSISRNMVIWFKIGAIIKNIVCAPGIWLFGPKWVHLSKSSFMLLECGNLVLMGAIIKITIHAPKMWLLGPNGRNYQNYRSSSWNMVIWSLMGAIIKIVVVHAPGIWLYLYGPKWMQYQNHHSCS